MNKKLLAQVALILLFFIVIFSFTKIYNKNDNKNFNSEIDKKTQKIEEDIKKNKNGTIEGLEYLSKDVSGNIYNIKAQSGIIDEENSDLIYLINVKAELKFDNNKVIYVSSNKAIYNNYNYDTVFSGNVILDYDVHKIYCERIDAKFSENLAVISNDIIYENLTTKLFADQMEIDLLLRNTEISMFNKKNKIKIIHKNNGTN